MDPSLAPQIDAPAIFASVIILSILAGSAILWILQIQGQQKSVIPSVGIASWSIGWANFFLYLIALFIGVVVTQNIMVLCFSDMFSEEVQEITPWLAVIAVVTLQLPLLGVFYAARRFFPEIFAGQLNRTNLSLVETIKVATPLFIRYLPIIWIASLVWSNILTLLQKFGLIKEFPPQELVTLLSKGGDPLAIGLLIISAIFLAPIVEELIFRGCIYRFFKSKMSLLASQIVSGVLFSIMHFNLMSLVPLIVVGFLLNIVYEKSGNILVPICFHAFFNAFSLLMVFIMSQSEIMTV